MSHFTAACLSSVESERLKQDMLDLYRQDSGPVLGVFERKLEKPMQQFDINTEVAPRNVYLTPTEIESIARHYDISPAEPWPLALKLQNWNGCQGLVDQRGIYYVTTQNPDGKFDSWDVYDMTTPEALSASLATAEHIPQALILPNFTWIESPEWFYSVGPNNHHQFQTWIDELKSSLNQYSGNYLVVMIDCHI